jgi:hypothetical protein
MHHNVGQRKVATADMGFVGENAKIWNMFHIFSVVPKKPILKLLGQHFRLRVPPAYVCSLFALIAHSSPSKLLTLRAYYQESLQIVQLKTKWREF